MKKGEIWIIDIESASGHEQEGLRPAVVVADVVGPVVSVIPCTSNLESLRFPFTLQINPTNQNGLDRLSVAIIFQLRAIDRKKFKKKIGFLENKESNNIDLLIKKMLKI